MSKLTVLAAGALIVAGVAADAVAPAQAQDAVFSGEGSLSAGTTSGNTETSDIGIGFTGSRKTQLWTAGVEALADYAEAEGIETKNRLFLAGQLDRQLTDRSYAFGRASHERDEFSGFDSRTFVGGGLGYQIIDRERSRWSVEGGPGVKIDEIGETVVVDDLGMTMGMPGETVESFSVIASSAYGFDFNDAVRFTNDTDVIYAEESTQVGNIAAITADLTGSFAARFSFDVRHDTNPPEGFEDTDTATRVSIIYTMGEE